MSQSRPESPELGRIRGRRNEQRVANALKQLQVDGEIDGFVWVGQDKRPSHKNLDAQGIDLIAVRNGLGLPIQVKSHRHGVYSFRRRGLRIPVIILHNLSPRKAVTKAKNWLRSTPESYWKEEYFRMYEELIRCES